MSKQDLLLHWVSLGLQSKQNEDEIVKKAERNGVSESDMRKAIEIYHYKSQHDEIPKEWISEFKYFTNNYLKSRNPASIGASYLNKPLEYLSGIDLVSLEIALCNNGKYIFEDFCKQMIANNPVLGIRLNINNMMHFPAYQSRSQHNYKFLYHLLFAYPEVGIIGGPYSYKRSGAENHTVIALYNHRQYLIEKALKGGGLAFCLNVFNRIVVSSKYKFKAKPSISKISIDSSNLDYLLLMDDFDYGYNSKNSELNNLYLIPVFSDYFQHFFYYCAPLYSRRIWEEYKEIFEEEIDDIIDIDSDEYDTLFSNYMQKRKFQVMVQFIEAVKPLLPEYRHKFIKCLTYHLGMIASDGNLGSAAIVMKAGARINLDKKIANNQTCDVITEALCRRTDGIKILIEIFQNASEKEFDDDNSRISDSQIEYMFEYGSTTHTELKQLKSVLMSKDFMLTGEAKKTLQQQEI